MTSCPEEREVNLLFFHSSGPQSGFTERLSRALWRHSCFPPPSGAGRQSMCDRRVRTTINGDVHFMGVVTMPSSITGVEVRCAVEARSFGGGEVSHAT